MTALFLPMSWSLAPEYKLYPLVLSDQKTHWIPFADVLPDETPDALVDKIHRSPQALILRGCPPPLVPLLKARGGEVLAYGTEALLDLAHPHLNRKSLAELIRRGRRHGQIHEMPLEKARQSKVLDHFFKVVRETYPAHLRYLYRQNLDQSHRIFVYQSEQGILGLISLIYNGPTAWHTELLLRFPASPVGVMEALVAHVFETLKAEEQRWLSLGEVPFFPDERQTGVTSEILVKLGQKIEFAYSARGLYQFKQKFRPFWRDLYLYQYPQIRWRTLGELFFKSNCHQLIFKSLLKRKASL